MGAEESQIECICDEIQNKLSTKERCIHMDEVEVILCESKEGRLLKKFDLVIKGQSLFKLDENGASWMKLYGSHKWVTVDMLYTK